MDTAGMYDVQDSFHYDYKVNISSPILVSIAGGQTRISDFDAYIYTLINTNYK